jgi:6-phosphogluconolactonase
MVKWNWMAGAGVGAGLMAGSAQADDPVRADRVWFGSAGPGDDAGIYVAGFDPSTGALGEPRLVAKLKNAGFQALSPDGKRLYSVCEMDGGEAGVAAFRVKNDGGLVELNRRATGGKGVCFVGLDKTGRCVLAANYGDGTVSSFPVLKDGVLGECRSFHRHAGGGPNKKRQKGPHAHSIYAGPENRFAYASDLGIDKVMIYRLSAEHGRLTPAGAADLPPGSGPRHMKFSADGHFAYVLNELSLTGAVFGRNRETGALDRLRVVPVLPKDADADGITCSEILVSPDGKFLYTGNRDTAGRGRDSLSVLAAGEDGKLSLIQTLPAEIEIPRHINMDPAGGWLLVCGQKSGEISVFQVDGDSGRLRFTGKKLKLPAPKCATFGSPLAPR